MYTIEVRYQTGNSFAKEEQTDTIGLQWEDKALARKALKTLKENYDLYTEKESSWRRSRSESEIMAEAMTKEWWIKSEKCEWDLKHPSLYNCAVEMDNGEWRNLPVNMWCGYFETLYKANCLLYLLIRFISPDSVLASKLHKVSAILTNLATGFVLILAMYPS